MKKRFIVFFVFILLFFSPLNLFVINANASNNWIIDGDTVYIDDENVYLSATPHTLINDGWVVFELETKTYKGKIDIIWGFDTPSCTPLNPQIWRNYTHELTGYHYVDRIGNIEIYNVTGWVNLGIENYNNYSVDYGNINNTYLMNISYETNKTLIIAFTSYIEFGDGDDYRLTGHYDSYESYIYYETYFDWLNWDANFEIINYEHGGMNKWFLLKEISVIPNYRYKVRAWMDIPFNTIGKYWWCIKPSNRTIPKAIEKGLFYCLDPWWNTDFEFYKIITIDSDYIDSNLINFPVLVVIDDATADKCNGGDSIRFLHLDNTTEYYYEIEKWVDNEDRLIWVNVTSISSTVDTKFLMYYNNSDATNNQNPSNVWDNNFLAVWHMNSLLDSTSNNIDLTNDGAISGVVGKIGYCYDFEFDDVDSLYHSSFLDSGFDVISVECWSKHESDINGNYISKRNIAGQDRLFFRRDVGNLNFFLEGSNSGTRVADGGAIDVDTWNYAYGSYNKGDQLRVFLNTTESLGDVQSNSLLTGTADHFLIGKFSSVAGTNAMDGLIDEIRISGIVRSDGWVTTSFHTQNQTDGFMSFGSEQSKPLGNAPQINNIYPVNESTENTLFPVLGVTVNDEDSDVMTITWYSNLSGTWEIIGNNLSNVNNGTYYQKFSEFGIYGLTYYWNTSVSDNDFTIHGNVSSFTVESTPSTTGNEGEIGLLGIFGFFGFLLYRKFHKKSSDKK